jgi:hypothetical protein
MLRGCLLVAAIVLVLVILLMAKCGYSLYHMSTTELPVADAAVRKLIDLYDRDDYRDFYAMCDDDWANSIPLEKTTTKLQALKRMTGKVTILERTGYFLNQVNAQSYMRLNYRCSGEYGETQLTIELHQQGGWKIRNVNFNPR